MFSSPIYAKVFFLLAILSNYACAEQVAYGKPVSIEVDREVTVKIYSNVTFTTTITVVDGTIIFKNIDKSVQTDEMVKHDFLGPMTLTFQNDENASPSSTMTLLIEGTSSSETIGGGGYAIRCPVVAGGSGGNPTFKEVEVLYIFRDYSPVIIQGVLDISENEIGIESVVDSLDEQVTNLFNNQPCCASGSISTNIYQLNPDSGLFQRFDFDRYEPVVPNFPEYNPDIYITPQLENNPDIYITPQLENDSDMYIAPQFADNLDLAPFQPPFEGNSYLVPFQPTLNDCSLSGICNLDINPVAFSQNDFEKWTNQETPICMGSQ